MLIAETPEILQIGGIILGAVVGIASLAGLIAGAVYVVKSRKITTNNTLADSAVASLTSSNQALEARLALVEKDNEHCLDLKRQQDKVIEAQSKRITELEKWVTARDLVEHVDAKVDALSAVVL